VGYNKGRGVPRIVEKWGAISPGIQVQKEPKERETEGRLGRRFKWIVGGESVTGTKVQDGL